MAHDYPGRPTCLDIESRNPGGPTSIRVWCKVTVPGQTRPKGSDLNALQVCQQRKLVGVRDTILPGLGSAGSGDGVTDRNDVATVWLKIIHFTFHARRAAGRTSCF